MVFLYPRAVKVAAVVGTGGLIVAIACHILCLATPYYFTLSDTDVVAVLNLASLPVRNVTYGIHYGLWEICEEDNFTHVDLCHRMTSNSTFQGDKSTDLFAPDWLTAPRALLILGLLLAAAGVVFLVAHILTRMEKLPQLFLATATGACILGGILILSGDIAFAAKNKIAFYAESPKGNYFFPKPNTDQVTIAYLAQQYDNRITSGWSFILDLISGALCIVSGTVFAFIAVRLQWSKDVGDKRPLDDASRSHKDTILTSRV